VFDQFQNRERDSNADQNAAGKIAAGTEQIP
jgi:hypothetical protein